MKKDFAQQLMSEIALLDIRLNQIAHLIEQIEDENERKVYRRAIITVIGDVYTELMVPTLRQYPELDPDKE